MPIHTRKPSDPLHVHAKASVPKRLEFPYVCDVNLIWPDGRPPELYRAHHSGRSTVWEIVKHLLQDRISFCRQGNRSKIRKIGDFSSAEEKEWRASIGDNVDDELVDISDYFPTFETITLSFESTSDVSLIV